MKGFPSHRAVFPVGLLMLVVASIIVIAEEQPDKFNVGRLVGRWRGEGSFVMPMTGIDLSVEGEAVFTPDTAHGYLHTAMSGSKFMFSYADSGHLMVDSLTDSLRWEIWDGFGRYVIYEGAAEGNTLTGKRLHGSRLYTIHTDFIGNDSIEFKLISVEEDSLKTERAHFNLGRVR